MTRMIRKYKKINVLTIILRLLIVGIPAPALGDGFLIPPASREIINVMPYLENSIAKEDVTKEILSAAERYCKKKIASGASKIMFESQLFKIHLDRVFLRQFNNASWLERHISRDKEALEKAENKKDCLKLINRIERFEKQLIKLLKEKSHLKLTKLPKIK